MITLADIQARWPGTFDEADAAVGAAVIAEAGLTILESKWGDWYDIGMLYLSAHLLALTPGQSDYGDPDAAGPTTSRRVGDVAVSYSSLASESSPLSDVALNATIFGRQYLAKRRVIQGGPLVASQG